MAPHPYDGSSIKDVFVADGDPGPAEGTGEGRRVLLSLEWLWRAEVLLELPLDPCGWLPGLLLAQKGVRWCTVKGLLNTVAFVAL